VRACSAGSARLPPAEARATAASSHNRDTRPGTTTGTHPRRCPEQRA